MVGNVVIFRGSKFEVTCKNGEKLGIKQINPNNGKTRKNAKEIFVTIEQVEVLE